MSPDGRRRVDLVNNSTDRTTTAYSRYLMSVKERRFLSKDEEVDHIDCDESNDTLENLQILSIEEHRFKTSMENSGRTYVKLVCPNCLQHFMKEKRQVKEGVNSKCSKSCNGQYSRKLQTDLLCNL